MRFDIVVPAFPPAHWNFSFAMDLEGSRYSHPPLGAATLAAYAPEGVTVRILDENVEPFTIDDLAEHVGISAMYIQRRRAFELARSIRATGRTVVLGGGLTNALPSACEEHADAVVHGEAELTFSSLLGDLESGRPAPTYRASERFDLGKSRTPRFDLLRLRAYSTGSIQTSRGCPYACDYCDVPLLDGPRPRTKTISQVMEEISLLHGQGLRSIFFVDDHFLGHRRFALSLLEEIKRFVERARRKPLFYCQATLNVAKDPETLEALRLANFRRLFIGIESSEVAALESANKHHNLALPIEEAVRRIQRHNITVWAAMLAGFDGDTPQTFQRYEAFVSSAKVGMIVPGILQAVPGTTYHERMTAAGRLVPLRNGYVAGQAGSLDSLLTTNVRPDAMSREQLLDGYRAFVRSIYEYDAYADRVLGALELGEYPELDGATPEDVWDAKEILARTFVHYVVRGDGESRRFFRRFIRFLLKHRFRRVDETIFHLVIYKHLREFYRQAADARVPLAEDLAAAALGAPPAEETRA